MEPLFPPKQEMFVDAEIVAVGDPAFGTTTVAVEVQRFASVTVTVYEPAIKPEAEAAFPPEGAHA
jgi:hypothetical protein